MSNFLEQLTAEWYEFQGYFVRRNINVGRLNRGGWECELDVVAFNPIKRHLLHLEPSMDADNWQTREKRFRKKFEAGARHIPALFKAFEPLPKIEQIAIFAFGSVKNHKTIGGGRILMTADFMNQIREGIKDRTIKRSSIPEQYTILRALLFAKEYWN